MMFILFVLLINDLPNMVTVRSTVDLHIFTDDTKSKIYEVVTYPSIGTLYLRVIGPSTQCACANYSWLAITSAQIWRPSTYSSYPYL
jgi:hypothetical protein